MAWDAEPEPDPLQAARPTAPRAMATAPVRARGLLTDFPRGHRRERHTTGSRPRRPRYDGDPHHGLPRRQADSAWCSSPRWLIFGQRMSGLVNFRVDES